MAFSLMTFVRNLLETGSVIVPAPQTPREDAQQALRELDASARPHMPGEPPALSVEVGVWALDVLVDACQAFRPWFIGKSMATRFVKRSPGRARRGWMNPAVYSADWRCATCPTCNQSPGPWGGRSLPATGAKNRRRPFGGGGGEQSSRMNRSSSVVTQAFGSRNRRPRLIPSPPNSANPIHATPGSGTGAAVEAEPKVKLMFPSPEAPPSPKMDWFITL